MDKGYGSGILKNPKAAKIIIDGWKFFDKEKYDLCSYVVMPNHVHLLIKTYEEPVSRIIKSWKSFTAKAIRKCFASSNHAEYNSAPPEILMAGTPFLSKRILG